MSSLQVMHDIARQRFQNNPSKCYQRHIRELYAEQEKRTSIASLDGARVEVVSNKEAETIISKFEWLQKMGAGTIASYGLKLNGEILGVACFGRMGGSIGEICVGDSKEETRALASQTVCLQRGACVPWAPANSASFLIRWACRQAYKDYGWRIFFAYSDSEAGEVGTVYQSVGWFFIGTGNGKSKTAFHADYYNPQSGQTLTSYAINHNRLGWMKKFGAPKTVPFRSWLRQNGWIQTRKYSHNKGRYVWFEKTPEERSFLQSTCRWAFKPYPKRAEPAAAA